MSENTIKIFTDGACKGNPGSGGWGALIIENGEEQKNEQGVIVNV